MPSTTWPSKPWHWHNPAGITAKVTKELNISIHRAVYAATDEEDHCLRVIDYGHGGLRFSAQRRSDGDYMAADLSDDQVAELIAALAASTNTKIPRGT